MEQYGNQDKAGTIEHHNRLDLILGSENFNSQYCGSTHGGTGKPHYCCFDCPALKGTEPVKVDDPKAAEIESLKKRLSELQAA